MILWNLDLLFDDPVVFFTVIPLAIIALLPMLVFHEVSHGYVANWLGDPTAKYLGRLSLNPLQHLDKTGTLMLLLIGFGWAKPVPVNANSLGMDPRKGMAIVGAAGPASNFLMALVFSIIYRAASIDLPNNWDALSFSDSLGVLIFLIVQINIVLGVLNLIPVPPLDGYRIAVGILPYEYARSLAQAEKYAPQIILVFVLLLMFTNILGGMVGVLVNAFLGQDIY